MYDDLYNDYDYNDNNNNSNKISKFFNTKNIIIIACCIVLFIILCFFIGGRSSNSTRLSKYDILKNDIIARTNDYIIDHNIYANSEIYLDSNKLGVNELYDCSVLSGAIVDDNNVVYPYLVCDNYKSRVVDNSNEFISLIGDDVIFLGKNERYLEPGFVNNNYYDVRINNNIGSESGVYNTYYTVISGNNIVDVLKRKIVILDDSLISNLYPSIIVNTNDTININESIDIYDFNASDIVDGNITSRVKVEGSFNNKIDGIYNITYSVTNSRGYTKNVNREIRVVDNKKLNENDVYSLLSPSIQTSDDVKILLSVNSDIFSYVILPDNSISYNKTIEYRVNKNGIYDFKIFDNKGNFIVKNIVVNNIVINNLYGSCTFVKDFSGILTITVNSNANVFNYVIDSINYGDTYSSIYYSNSLGNSVSVLLKDNYGNSKNINCTKVTLQEPSVPSDPFNPSLKPGRTFTFKSTRYYVASTNNDLSTFESKVKNRVSQSANSDKYGSACLSFAQYHSYMLQKGNMGSLSLSDGGGYKYASSFTDYLSPNVSDIMLRLYEELINNRVAILMVNGNSARTSRHFVTVVGFKTSVTSGSNLQPSDLLILDSWGGNIRSMDPSMDKSYRSIFKQNGNYRLRVFK